MKIKDLNHAEEKYLFGLSRLVWRVLVMFLVLVLAGSLILFLWSVIPVAKPRVTKAEYPAEIMVTPGDIAKLVEDAKQKEKKANSTAGRIVETYSKREPAVADTAKSADDLALQESMKKLRTISDKAGMSWEPVGYYEYPYGEYYYYNWGEQYRQYVITDYGVRNKVNNAIYDCNIRSSKDKKMLIDNLMLFLEKSSLKHHSIIINSVSYFWKDDLSTSLNRVNMFKNVLNKVPASDFEQVLYMTANFTQDNPNDGLPFMAMADTAMNQVNSIERTEFLRHMIWGYEQFFNGQLYTQAHLTDSFLAQLKSMPKGKPGEMIYWYYSLSVSQNMQRQSKIDSIDQAYETELAAANYKHDVKRFKDKQNRIKAGYGIGGSIILISILALTLVFFSMHKYLKKVDALLEKLTVKAIKEKDVYEYEKFQN